MKEREGEGTPYRRERVKERKREKDRVLRMGDRERD
jgi:hypothetical protein